MGLSKAGPFSMHNAAYFFAFVSKYNCLLLGGAGTLPYYEHIKQDLLPAEQRRGMLASLESFELGIPLHSGCVGPCSAVGRIRNSSLTY